MYRTCINNHFTFLFKPSTSHRCTDPDLSRMESVTLQSHCLWRRALVAVINMNKLLPHTLAKKMSKSQIPSHLLIILKYMHDIFCTSSGSTMTIIIIDF